METSQITQDNVADACIVCKTLISEKLILTNLSFLICMNCLASDNYSEIDKINEKILLGNAEAQKRRDILKAIGVTHILVVGKELKIHHPNDFTYEKIKIEDDEAENISKYFEKTFNFIENAKGLVFVHCMAGVSRSATIVIAYLMRKEGKTYDEARKFVKGKRVYISPNDGFVTQLKEFEEKLRNEKLENEKAQNDE